MPRCGERTAAGAEDRTPDYIPDAIDMKIKRKEPRDAQVVLAGMITNADVVRTITDRWPEHGGLFDAPWANLVGGWCVDHWKQHGKPLDTMLRHRWEDWAAKTEVPEETVRGVEQFLRLVDEEHDHDLPERKQPEYVLDLAERYFKSVQLKAVAAQMEDMLELGRVQDAEKLIVDHVPVSLNGHANKLFTVLGMDEIFSGEVPQIPYLIPGILVKGQPCIVAGPEKCLKTTILLDLAVSLASESYFLGHYRVQRPCNVLIMSGESGEATLRRNLHTMTSRWGRVSDKRHWPKRLSLCDAVPRFDDKRHLAELRELLEVHEAEVLIVDTAGGAMPGDKMSASFHNYELCARVAEVCKEFGTTFLLAHHTAARLTCGAVPQLSDISYAGFKEFFRAWIMVNRRKPYEIDDGPRVHELWINAGGSAGHSTMFGVTANEGTAERPMWHVNWMPYGETKAGDQQAKDNAYLDEDVPRVLEQLQGGGMTKNQLRDALRMDGRKYQRLSRALDTLVAEGRVVKGKVLANSKREGFALATTEPVT